MTNEATPAADGNVNTSKHFSSDSPLITNNDQDATRSGRFRTFKVKEEGFDPPSHSNAPVISSPCFQISGVENVAQCDLQFKKENANKDLDSNVFVGSLRIDPHLLESLKNIDTAHLDSYCTVERNKRKPKAHGLLKRLCRKVRIALSDPKKIGFKHVCLLMMVLVYTLLGATVFYYIESAYEHKTVSARKAALDATILKIAQEITLAVNDPRRTIDLNTMITFLEESAYVGSTFYKAEDMDHNLKWTFGSSFFFSMNVFTTTGYGSIAPESLAGKTCVIIYGFLFVPLTLVVIRHLGNWVLLQLTNIYAVAVIRWRRFRLTNDVEDGEVFTLPIFVCMLIMFAYLMGTTTFIFVYDSISGPAGTGISYFLSFYFSFISISTIGLGDVMPNNVTFDPTITILFFFGMPLMKVVNSSTYQCVEKATIGFLTLMERRLAAMWKGPEVSDITSEMPKQRTITLTEAHAPPLQENPNDLTIRSLVTYIKSDAHVYGRKFGRVDLTVRKETV